jgi:hemerythrin-like domain-containing protein
MKATEQLKEEHVGIKRMLSILDSVCDRLEAGEDIRPRHLEQSVEFIQVFADRCHHGKEEDLLFAAMEEVGFPRDRGPIGVMLAEHEQGRGYVRGLKAAVERYKAGDRRAISEMVSNARSYIALLSQHIDKEDNILYAMADAHLPNETQERLLGDFEKVELERIGAGRHEEFHHLLDELQQVYLTEPVAHL